MLSIQPIEAFNDNYIWVLSDQQKAWVVDPGDAVPVEHYLQDHQLLLEGVLITHHHPDHTGGVASLSQNRPDLTIYGPLNPNIQRLTDRLQDSQSVSILGKSFRVIATPGHTLDHICYFCEEFAAGEPALLSGDTLFAGGCGRLFEGTAAQMHSSLQTLAQLPTNTNIYCAHEYTLANLEFALAVEPDNSDLISRMDLARQARQQRQPTVPSRLIDELLSNPFLRVHQPNVVKCATQRLESIQSTDTEIFASIRSWKDHF